jgi:glutathionylspermidine synthase
MRRERRDPRPDWRRRVEQQGLTYAVDRDGDGAERPYWHEGAAYVFSADQIEHLETVTERLHAKCVEAAHAMAADDRYRRALGLEPWAWDYVRDSLAQAGPAADGVPSLYGRFDLAWDGESPVKLLEYNADTPAGLVEAAVCQWFWLEDVLPDRDQWNLLHEFLVATWRRIGATVPDRVVHLAVGRDEPDEDWATVAYLRDTAQEAGLVALGITMESIGWDSTRRLFVDERDRAIELCFAMYPWEWLLGDDFGPYVTGAAGGRGGPAPTTWLEPAWKLLLGSKALLAALWETFPGDEDLLPASLDGPGQMRRWVSKPVFGWEGAGIEVVAQGAPLQVQPDGGTSGQARVWQEFVDLPVLDGARPVLGTWVVGGRPAGLGIRESDGLVTDARARFVPHWIDAPRSTPEQVAGWVAGTG